MSLADTLIQRDFVYQIHVRVEHVDALLVPWRALRLAEVEQDILVVSITSSR